MEYTGEHAYEEVSSQNVSDVGSERDKSHRLVIFPSNPKELCFIGKNPDIGLRPFTSILQLRHLLATRHQTSHLISLNLSWSICKMRTLIPSSQGCCRREMTLKELGHWKMTGHRVWSTHCAAMLTIRGARTWAVLTNWTHIVSFVFCAATAFTLTAHHEPFYTNVSNFHVLL